MTDAEQDPVMERIGVAVNLGQAGDARAARRRFAEVWDEIGRDGDPIHRCALAHYAADVQDDVKDELMWDLRALAAADEVTDERAQRYHGSLSVAGFYPSLHLNVADAYRRSGDRERACAHLRCAQEAIEALADDGYGQMIRAGVARLADRLMDAAPIDDGTEAVELVPRDAHGREAGVREPSGPT